MKHILIFILFIISVMNGYSQAKKKTFNDCSRVKNYEVYLNDTIINKCDTAYIINGRTLNFYKSSSKDLKEIILIQEKQIAQQDKEFDQLRVKFDSLGKETTMLIDRSDNKLGEVDGSLNKVNKTLLETKDLIKQTQEIVKEEKKNAIKTRFKWGVGGFTIGITSTALLFMMFNK